MSIAFIVRRFIDKYDYREPIFIDDLQLGENQRNARNCELYKLEAKGIIKQYKKGIYYKPKITKFGELGIDKDKLLEYKYLRGENGKVEGYVTGPSVWYNLNITTQVPKNKWIVSNKVSYTKIDNDLFVRVIAPKRKVNDKLVKYFLLLDLIDQYDKIQDINYKKYDEFIRNTISKYQPVEFKILKRLSKDYNKFVRKVLGLYLEELYKEHYKNNIHKIYKIKNVDKYDLNILQDTYIELKKNYSSGRKYRYKVIDADAKKEWGLY